MSNWLITTAILSGAFAVVTYSIGIWVNIAGLIFGFHINCVYP